MKYIGILFFALFGSQAIAKPLPPMNEIIQRLNSSGVSEANNWVSVGETKKQNVEGGVMFVSPTSISSMMTVNGDDAEELMASYTLAGIHCVKSSLEAIDMSHHDRLPQSMYNSMNNALKSPTKKAKTLVWGYDYETEITQVEQGLLVSCSLK